MAENIIQVMKRWQQIGDIKSLYKAIVSDSEDISNASVVAIFTLDDAKENILCQQTSYINNTTNYLPKISLYDKNYQEDPIVWAIKNDKTISVKGSERIISYNMSFIDKIWQRNNTINHMFIVPLKVDASFSSAAIAFLSEAEIPLENEVMDLIEAAKITLSSAIKINHLQKKLDLLLSKQKEDLSTSITKHSSTYSRFLYKSLIMDDINNKLKKVAPTSLIVCLTGQTGVGKDVIASEIHNMSNRAKQNFVSINCSAISTSLLESELFGYMKGSHSQATKDYKGIFLQAGSGTLFLDEIAELDEGTQTKLLRVLQNNTVRPIGATKDYRINCRIIVATNKNLEEMVANGLFRKDLYYRIKQYMIYIPPLNQRIEDIDVLAPYFLQEIQQREGIYVKGITDNAINWLKNKHFPGNVRELRSLIERAVIEVNGFNFIDIEQLETASQKNISNNESMQLKKDASFKDLLDSFEKDLLLKRLAIYNGKAVEAANSLDMSYRTFYNRCKKLNLLT